MAYIRCVQCGGYYEDNNEFCPRCHHPTRISRVFNADCVESEYEAEMKGYVIEKR